MIAAATGVAVEGLAGGGGGGGAHACAGPLVMVPAVRERVFYLPQGHVEQVRTGGRNGRATAKPLAAKNHSLLPRPPLKRKLLDVSAVPTPESASGGGGGDSNV
ncbi:hypothetical protein E2562_001568 [Oryza meyeriana var. granulata]|uniref:Auxin-responsive protein n=1 Tax=Oryza meyeriana var. granulata TaxID=110450 RepID=A0A6G1CCA9_9ORYZ|nr:hypothetical protein E2562_001568 [Oryza meyeriana var. granulata]